MDRNDLVKTAKELNQVLGLQPAINIILAQEELREAVLEASGLLEEGDCVSKSSQEVIQTLKNGIGDVEKEEEVEMSVEKKVAEKKVANVKTPSNKFLVFSAWKEGESDIKKISDAIHHGVKETTIKSWINQWKNKKNLPSGVV